MAAYGQVARSGCSIGNEASNQRARAKATPGMETEVTRVRDVRRSTALYSQAYLPQKPSADND